MAEIFLAKSADPKQAGNLLAIKRTLPEYGGDREFLSMFLDEAYISTSLVHPNICRVIDTGQNGKELYLVMEFVHGKDLRMIGKRLKKMGRELPPLFAAMILSKIARALYYAHTKCDPVDGKAQNIVHRDVNPQNILISYQGLPKLIDFGIAKAKDRVSKTRVGVLKGKFSYLSPEQVLGQPIDGRSDVFALGVVLYSLLVGSRPFEARSEPALLLKISEGKYIPASELKPDLAPGLEAIIDKALQKDVSQRYRSASEMADDLDSYMEKFPAVKDEDLGEFVRELFEEQYERELKQIEGYHSGSPEIVLNDTLADTLDSPNREELGEETVAILQQDGASEGVVAMATVLAAGYDTEKSGSETLTKPNSPLANEMEMAAKFDSDATHMLADVAIDPGMVFASSESESERGSTEVSKKSPNSLEPSNLPPEASANWDADATLALSESQVSNLAPSLIAERSKASSGPKKGAVDPDETLRQAPEEILPHMRGVRRAGVFSRSEVRILLVAAILGVGIVSWVYSTKIASVKVPALEKTTVIEVPPVKNQPAVPN